MKDKETIEIQAREIKNLKAENQRLRSFLIFLVQSINGIEKEAKRVRELSGRTQREIYKNME